MVVVWVFAIELADRGLRDAVRVLNTDTEYLTAQIDVHKMRRAQKREASRYL